MEDTNVRFDGLSTTGHIIPESPGIYDLGTSLLRFGEGHFDNLFASDATITNDLTVGGNILFSAGGDIGLVASSRPANIYASSTLTVPSILTSTVSSLGPLNLTSTGTINLTSSSSTLTLGFNTSGSDGSLAFESANDYFKFSDDVLINSGESLYFRDTIAYITSGSSGTLALSAINGVSVSHDLTVGGDINLFYQDKIVFYTANNYIMSEAIGVLDIVSPLVDVIGDLSVSGTGHFDGVLTIAGKTTITNGPLFINNNNITGSDTRPFLFQGIQTIQGSESRNCHALVQYMDYDNTYDTSGTTKLLTAGLFNTRLFKASSAGANIGDLAGLTGWMSSAWNPAIPSTVDFGASVVGATNLGAGATRVTFTKFAYFRAHNWAGGTFGGTIDNLYGLHIEALSQGTTNYGVYIENVSDYAIKTNTGAVDFGDTLNVTGVTTLSSGLVLKTNRLTGNTTLDNTYREVFCTTTLTVTLPANPTVGQTYRIVNTGTGVVTIDPGLKKLLGVVATDTLVASEAVILTYETTEGWW
jgi:hypothetical protein